MKFVLSLCVWLSILYPALLFAQKVTLIDSKPTIVPLKGQQVLSLEDKQHNISIEKVLHIPDQQWKTPNANYTNFGISTSAYWVKIKVLNTTEQKIYLRIDNPVLDSAFLYVYAKGSLLMKKSILAKNPEMRVPNSPFILPSSKDTLTCYIKVSSLLPLPLPSYICTETVLLDTLVWNTALDIIFFGAILIMILYNSFLGITTRDRVYFYYVCYSLMLFITIAFVKGFPIAVLGKWAFLINDYFAVYVSLTSVFLSLFTKNFLQLPQKYVLGNKLLNVSIGLQFFVIFVFLIGFVQANVVLYQIANIFNNVCIFWVAWHLYRKQKYTPALVFMIAFAIYVFLVSATNLVYANLIPIYLYTLYFLHISAVVELTLFSIALGTKINVYKKEKEIAQEEALQLVKEQNVILETRVKERTLALNESNEELSTTLEVVAEQHKDIVSSINYASRIQNAIIPKEEEIKKYLPSFVLFKPCDIVSGDFYWIAEKENKVILVVADCTGHGVSGAFMTMIGNNILNQIVHTEEIHEPHLILNKMTPLLEKTFLHSGGEVKDGMDISILVFEKMPTGNTKVSFSGAMNPLYYVEKGEFKEVLADKVPIGAKMTSNYTCHNIEVEESTMLYLLSDGYQDQFGGPLDKKFMVKKLKNLLHEISAKEIQEQKEILTQTFEDWKGNRKQTDDVLLVGVKL